MMLYAPTVCFIIPSKGRPTLANTLVSLHRQTSMDFHAVVCFDDVEPTITNSDYVRVLRTPKKLGTGYNGAGAVRQYAIQKQLEYCNFFPTYFGFVDDDDILDPSYVENLYQINHKYFELNEITTIKQPDIVIFPMKYQDGKILPPPGEHDINKLEDKIGISFAIKAHMFRDGLEFQPSSGEDYNILKQANAIGAKFVFCSQVGYHVAPLGVAPDRR